MKKIKEVIVVEGKHDSAKLKKYFDVETFETSGSHMNKQMIKQISHLNKQHGIILFLDPDHVGEKIRSYINDKIPNLKNAFINKEKAKTIKKVGIEHAEYEDLKIALEHLITYEKGQETITYAQLYELGLVGQNDSCFKRKIVAKQFHLGDVNGKSLYQRLNKLKVTKNEVEKVL